MIEAPNVLPWFDSWDVRDVLIGYRHGDTVYISKKFGGGTVNFNKLNAFAEGYWNDYGSGLYRLKESVQDLRLKLALERLTSGGAIRNSHPAVQIVQAAAQGVRDGAVIQADQLTFNAIPSLHQESEHLIAENGGLYHGSKVAGVIARESLIAAGTAGVGKIATAPKVAQGVGHLLSKAPPLAKGLQVTAKVATPLVKGLQVTAKVATPVLTTAQAANVAMGVHGAVEALWRGDYYGAAEKLAKAGIGSIGLGAGLGASARILAAGARRLAQIPGVGSVAQAFHARVRALANRQVLFSNPLGLLGRPVPQAPRPITPAERAALEAMDPNRPGPHNLRLGNAPTTNPPRPDLFRTGNAQGPSPIRVGTDIVPDADGNVHPTTPPTGLSTYDRIAAVPTRGRVWRLPGDEPLPPGLAATPDAPPPGHVTIGPTQSMSLTECVERLARLPWVDTGIKKK